MIQAHLQLKDLAGAEKVLQKALKVPKVPQKPAGNTGGSARTSSSAAAAALPAKLIISAPKKLLDQAGGGKLSFEEFKKAATVEYLTFAGPEKPPAPQKPAK
jgi:hypothetical protein